jgi:HAD superfamily, subfamily IIIB (Acid phosphatase)
MTGGTASDRAEGSAPPADSRSPRRLLTALAAALWVAACAPTFGTGPTATARMRQPANVGDAKKSATEYRDSGAYARDLASVAAEAGDWIARSAPGARRPALVLDVDETALSNWEVIQADDFGRIIGGPCQALPEGACGWAAWDLLARSVAIEPTLALFRRARSLGVDVFFITGRPESQRSATERNLRAQGFDGFTRLTMVPDGARFASAAAFKAPVRAGIEREGWTIIANLGDQPSDLEGGHAARAFLLPNPFYRIP